MTITTPPQETRTRRPWRAADETAAPARRRAPSPETRDGTDANGAVEGRPVTADAARSGAATNPDGARTRTAAPNERRARRPAAPGKPAPKDRTADKPGTKSAAKSAAKSGGKPNARSGAKTATRPAEPAGATRTTRPARPTRSTRSTRPAKAVRSAAVRRSSAPPRAPFVLLVVGLLGGALVSLLLLNTVLAQDAFTLSELQRGNQQLSERKQALQEDINRENSPAVLHAKARALGMVDAKRPAFIDARTGRVSEGGTRPPGVSDDAMAAAAGAGVTGAPGAIMPPAGGAPPQARTPHKGHPHQDAAGGDGRTGGGTR